MHETRENPSELVKIAWLARVEIGAMTSHSLSRYSRVWDAFVRYAVARNVNTLEGASPSVCLDFVHARQRSGDQPAPATSRFRLTVIRDAFRILVAADRVTCDPTTGLRVVQPARLRRSVPLTPGEFARLRAAGRITPKDHLRPAVVELAAAGGSHEEISRVTVAAVDLALGQVTLGERRVDLDRYAASTLAARVAECRLRSRRNGMPWEPANTAVAMPRPAASYPASSIAPGISSSISRAMKAAGLDRSGIRPASLREYGANRRYAETGRVEDVAMFLGLTSLNHAMAFVDPGWQERYAEEVSGT